MDMGLSPFLHFTSQGKDPRVEDPRLGAPFPSLAEEGALGSPAEGAVSPCLVQKASGVQLRSRFFPEH